MIDTPYGMENLRSDFALRTGDPYLYSYALLNIMRAFLGYENANFVRHLVSLTKHIITDASRY